MTDAEMEELQAAVHRLEVEWAEFRQAFRRGLCQSLKAVESFNEDTLLKDRAALPGGRGAGHGQGRLLREPDPR
jgi:hypothetical protein